MIDGMTIVSAGHTYPDMAVGLIILGVVLCCVICGCVTPVAQISKETFVCEACKSAVKWAKERMMSERRRADDETSNA